MRTFFILFSIGFLNTLVWAETRPNLVLIVGDGIGRDWLSCYGAKQVTPNLDRLAQQGIRYQTCWSSPMKAPTEVTLLTGLYPFRHGWTQGDHASRDEDDGLGRSQWKLLPQFLKESGYTTVIGGHWRLNDLTRQPHALRQCGFDEHCVWTESDLRSSQSAPVGSGRVITNGKKSSSENAAEAANRYLREFISRQDAKRPFFLYYPMHLPVHTKDAAIFSKHVLSTDQMIGDLVLAIDHAGFTETTMVVFISNHGSTVGGTLNDQVLPASKGRLDDLGAHVPLIIRAPFLTSGKRVSRDLIDFSDLTPTFLQLAKVNHTHDLTFDGKSFVPGLRGSDDPFDKRNWIYSQLNEFRMVRDWHHLVDNLGHFHDLDVDPMQVQMVSPLDKQAPHRRQRLQMILDRFPADQSLRSTNDTEPDRPRQD